MGKSNRLYSGALQPLRDQAFLFLAIYFQQLTQTIFAKAENTGSGSLMITGRLKDLPERQSVEDWRDFLRKKSGGKMWNLSTLSAFTNPQTPENPSSAFFIT